MWKKLEGLSEEQFRSVVEPMFLEFKARIDEVVAEARERNPQLEVVRQLILIEMDEQAGAKKPTKRRG